MLWIGDSSLNLYVFCCSNGALASTSLRLHPRLSFLCISFPCTKEQLTCYFFNNIYFYSVFICCWCLICVLVSSSGLSSHLYVSHCCLFSTCSFWGIFGANKKFIASCFGRSFHSIYFKQELNCFFCVTVFLGWIFFFLFAALSPGSLFGLATFSHKIGLYDVQGPVPVVKNVFIPPDAESKLPLELEDAMPLLQFLAPVYCDFRNISFPVSYSLCHSGWLLD